MTERTIVLGLFTWQYLLMTFMAGLGVIQLAVARSGRRHLWLFDSRGLVKIAGILLVAGGIALYFLEPLWTAGPWGPPAGHGLAWGHATWETLAPARDVNDTRGGLAGYYQAIWFSVGYAMAAATAVLLGRRHRTGGRHG